MGASEDVHVAIICRRDARHLSRTLLGISAHYGGVFLRDVFLGDAIASHFFRGVRKKQMTCGPPLDVIFGNSTVSEFPGRIEASELLFRGVPSILVFVVGLGLVQTPRRGLLRGRVRKASVAIGVASAALLGLFAYRSVDVFSCVGSAEAESWRWISVVASVLAGVGLLFVPVMLSLLASFGLAVASVVLDVWLRQTLGLVLPLTAAQNLWLLYTISAVTLLRRSGSPLRTGALVASADPTQRSACVPPPSLAFDHVVRGL